MRKKIIWAGISLFAITAQAQDSLRTTTLDEIVVTGTKFDLPVEQSGKTIFKLTAKDLERNAGKMLPDLLNEIPGLQIDGNFGTPGSNISYFLRGGRNRHTLILIDGVPLNDPSAINAEYDLRFIPVSQIESIEVLKGGLSTLYGTGAAAGVINIRLKKPADKFQGSAEAQTASYQTHSVNAQVSGSPGKFSYLGSIGKISSKGFSAALDEDESQTFDNDGFDRFNFLGKVGYQFTPTFKMNFHSAFESFNADYDAYEFNDAPNTQEYRQLRLGVDGNWLYKRGSLEGKVFGNWIGREYRSSFPSRHSGINLQGEVIHRHRISEVVQTLSGVNIQQMSFDEENMVDSDSANVRQTDPYVSVLVSLPSGFNLHAGLRLNTHSIYGEKLVYNINPSFTFNQNGHWNYKLYASAATSYVTPSLYQLFSVYGNRKLKPEEAVNVEVGTTVYFRSLEITAAYFKRDETNPIDFFSIFDNEGNWLGAEYRNFSSERKLNGFEVNARYAINQWIDVNGHYSFTECDNEASFYRIPKVKYGAGVIVSPTQQLNISLKYNFTGDRRTYDFNSFSEVTLRKYSLVDAFTSFTLLKNKLTLFGAVNNVFDEDFIGVLGYTTRGRNFSLGARYNF